MFWRWKKDGSIESSELEPRGSFPYVRGGDVVDVDNDEAEAEEDMMVGV